jgi:phosphatidylserine decarboxylase
VNLSAIRERLLMDLVRWAPKGTFSQWVGFCAKRQLPRALRRPLYRAFARRVGADLHEVELPLEDYRSLDEFFTRKLRQGARPIETGDDVIVSPCDGTLSACGTAHAGQLIQAKGRDYRVFALLCDRATAARFEGGSYVTIYLAPRDYHRVHSPVAGQVTGFHHIPGAFFPVNALAVKHVDGLFTRNERLITYLDSAVGETAVVMVAATGVGHMSVVYDAVETHRPGRGRPGARVRFSAPRAIGKGEELGTFHLGSTVVLLFEPGRVKLESLTAGQRIRLGEPIARRLSSAARGDAAA